MIESAIYTLSTKDKVVNPSQWKDDMYITLKWECPSCGKTYLKCDCEGSRETFKPTLERDDDDQRTAWIQAMAGVEKHDCTVCGKHGRVCICCGHCYEHCQCTPDDLPSIW